MKLAPLLVGLMFLWATPSFSQDLTPADVRISLDKALPIALKAAAKAFPDLHKYILYSVTPRVLKGDRGGLHWQVEWQEKAFPHYKRLWVRVYMRDGSLQTERLEKGEYQKEHGTYQPPTILQNREAHIVVGKYATPNARHPADAQDSGSFISRGPCAPLMPGVRCFF